MVLIIDESLSQHDEKHVVPTPFSGIRVEKRKIVGTVFDWMVMFILACSCMYVNSESERH
jgi:hypothetical protein